MNYLGEFKRLTSAFEVKTEREIIKNNNHDDDIYNEYKSENKFDDDSIIFDDKDNNDYDHIEARNEQIKRLQHLQNLAGDAGEIPGMFM